MLKLLAIILLLISCLINWSNSGVPLSRYEQLMKKDDNNSNLGLYNNTDHVISVSYDNLKTLVLNQKYATLLEFYNSFCGHCRRFASKYKELADEVWSWRNFIKIMAIDCANDKNNDICREYEIMSYPTLRYFSPNYPDDTKSFGLSIQTQNIQKLKTFIMLSLVNETQHSFNDSWPDFSILNISKNQYNFFQNISNTIKLGILIYEHENSTLGTHLILDFHHNPYVRIKRIVDSEIAATYHLETFNTIGILDRNNQIDVTAVPNVGELQFKKAIEQILYHNNIYVENDRNNNNNNEHQSSSSSVLNINQNSNERSSEKPLQKPYHDIFNEMKNFDKHLVYQADLEHALRYSIFHEVTKFSIINGERLLALQRYINVLSRYSPLGNNGRKFLKDLQEFVMTHNQDIRGENFQSKLSQLERIHSPIFSSSRWIGCTASKLGLRGFTCGLWQLFHYMTVQAAELEQSTDPLEILQAMHGYVKYFFGCSDCSKHFQAMATKNKIWNTASKDDAVLWLWMSHNEVNERLSGDETEDPQFPKIQFPSKESCGNCYRDETTLMTTNTNNNIHWDKQKILEFLKQIHNPLNISRFGIDEENVLVLLPSAAAQQQLKRNNISNAFFSTMDMRMGILLYGFCICMMLFAVKLFMYKGYRKKTYSHDHLGKV